MTERLGQLGLEPIAGADGDAYRALEIAQAHSDYIGHVLRRRPELGERLGAGPEAMLAEALNDIEAASQMRGPLDAPMRTMRRAKEMAHLAIAGADLAGIWRLDDVVERLTRLADV